jgi:adenylate kinase
VALVQRSDDHPEPVIRRLEEYKRSTAPLIEYYSQSGRLIEIGGEKPVDDVFEKLLAAVNGPNN